MGSPSNVGTRLVARFCNGACFGCGFVVASLVFTAMLWIVWFYFGLSVIQIADGQRRAVVSYSVNNPKPSPSSTTPAPSRTTTSFTEETSNSISKTPTAASALRGSSRGELPKTEKRKEGVIGALAKGDYADRDRVVHNVNNTRVSTQAPPVSPSPRGASKSEASAAILSGSSSEELDDDRIHARRILPTGTENRPDTKPVQDLPPAKRNPPEVEVLSRPDISPTKVRDVEPSAVPSRSPTDDGDRKNRGTVPEDYEDRDRYATGRRDEATSSRRKDPPYRDPDFVRDHPERGRDRTRYDDDDDDLRSSIRYIKRDRGRGSEDRYSKGDSRVPLEDEERPYTRDRSRERDPEDISRRRDEDKFRDYEEREVVPDRKYLSSSRVPDERISTSRLDRDDRYISREDDYKYHKYRDTERYPVRSDERYRSRDDDKYKARGDDRYVPRDDDRYVPRDDDRYVPRDDDRYRLREDDRYRSRDEDRYKLRDEDRYRPPDDDKLKPLDSDRYRDRDEERYKARDDERVRVDDRYSSTSVRQTERDKDGERYILRDDDRYVSRDGDRYVSRDGDRRYIERTRDEKESYTPRASEERMIDRDLKDTVSRARNEGVDKIQSSRSRVDDFPDIDARPVRSRIVEYPLSEKGTPARSRIIEDIPDREERPRVRSDSTLRNDQRDKSYIRDDIPSRPIVEDRYTDRGDGYRKYSDDDDRDKRISPTRTREEPTLPREILVDSRPARKNDDRYYEDRRILNTRVDSVSSSYISRSPTDEYKTRVPDEKFDNRREEVVLDRRSYASEEDDGYAKSSRTRNRYGYDDDKDLRRSDRDDDRYVRRDPVESGRSRSDDRTRSRDRYDDDYRKYDDDYSRYEARYPKEDDKPPLPPRERDSYSDDRTRMTEERSRREEDYDRSRSSKPSEMDEDRRSRDEYLPPRRSSVDESRDRRPQPARYDIDSKEILMGSSVSSVYSRETSDVDREKRGQSSDSRSRISSYDDRDYRDRGDREEPSRSSYSQERPLSAKDVIDAAIRHSDSSSQSQRKVFYPVFDPRLSNLTSPEIIRPSERRGTTITAKKRRSI